MGRRGPLGADERTRTGQHLKRLRREIRMLKGRVIRILDCQDRRCGSLCAGCLDAVRTVEKSV